MSGKRGPMTLEVKRQTILSIFHGSKQVYKLDEIEKIAASAGVVQKTVEEVLQGLVADKFVMCEKLGAINVYWSFPQR